MQVFEFHFNPKVSEDVIFDSFCYEPENIYEKRLGSLFLVCELKNVLPQNLKFLDNFANFLKGKYYSAPVKFSPEASLKESLKKANEFLEGIAKKGDVSWLGNLNLTVLSLVSRQKKWVLNFTKVGMSKILLLRPGQVIDIGKNLEFSEIEPYPLKIFGNIVSGKLAENDIILVLTKEVSKFFLEENLTDEIAKLSLSADEIEKQKSLKEILNARKDDLSKISGICLLIFLSKARLTSAILTSKKELILAQPKEFSLKQIFTPILVSLEGLIKKIRHQTTVKSGKGKKKTKVQLLKFGERLKSLKGKLIIKFPKVIFPRLRIPSRLEKSVAGLNIYKAKIQKFATNKNLILILFLILFLTIGFFIFQKEKEIELKKYQAIFNQIQEKVDLAESFLILKKTNPQAVKNANSLLKEAWEEILPLAKTDSALSSTFSAQIFSLENRIEKELGELNGLEKIEEPEILFQFSPEDFIPQKMILAGDELYFFSPYSQNLFKLDKEGKGVLIENNQKFNSAVSFDNSILLFSKPDQLTILTDRGPSSINLMEPYPDFDFDDFSSFRANLYFLDKKSGEIIKYPYLGNFNWNYPQLWLSEKTKKAIEAKSMTIDGSLWILKKDYNPPATHISRYYAGEFQEILKLDFFPYPKDFSKIFTSPNLPYLYILEPAQNRIVILNKKGEIIKQFQSEKFDNLMDFAVSPDGKTIYLLNGLKVYKISPHP